jgi:hypothetical protein
MVCRSGSFAVSALLVASAFLVPVTGFSQISFPGQYPGQYPGQSRYPGGGTGGQMPGQRRSTTTRDDQARVVTITGMLRKISSSELVVEADDKRIVTVSLASSTKYLKNSGNTAKSSDFGPGDHLTIDATQDDSGYYHAKNVTLVKKGTDEERAAASEPVDDSPVANDVKSSDRNSSSSDDGPPRLRRSSSGSDDSPKAEITPQQTTAVRPQIIQGDSPSSRSVASTSSDAPIPPDPDDSGPPKLRRGQPARRASDSPASSSTSNAPVQIAQNDAPSRPSLHADEVNGVTKAPPAPRVSATGPLDRPAMPSGSTGDNVIDNAREAAFSFAETLPNYVVKQFTTRYQTDTAHGNSTSWQAIDVVTADVVSEGGKESYKNILINGKAPRESIEKSGSWSTGEFSSVLLDILSPSTDADFHNRRSTTIVNRAAFRYDFSVAQENSHWHVYSAADSYRPEYTGAVWIDKENSRVLRIELSARNMPRAFPLDTVESAVDYDYVLIGDSKFVLPVHSEALSCERGTRICSRNVIDFRNYKKFGADTSITFDTPQ